MSPFNKMVHWSTNRCSLIWKNCLFSWWPTCLWCLVIHLLLNCRLWMKNGRRTATAAHNGFDAELNVATAFVNVRPVPSNRVQWNIYKKNFLLFGILTNNNVTNAGGLGALFSFWVYFLLVFFIPFLYSLGCKRLQLEERGRVKTAQVLKVPSTRPIFFPISCARAIEQPVWKTRENEPLLTARYGTFFILFFSW